MARFPRIQSVCPYLDRFDEIIEGTACGLCKRDVFDLTAMSDEGRAAFLQSCSGEVCVSYRLRPTFAAAAMAVAAVVLPSTAAADDQMIIVTGGTIHDPARVEYIEVDDSDLPELPVVHEDAPDSRSKIAAPPARGGGKPGRR